MEVLHTCLNVSDVEESIAFYEQFGFEETWGFEAGGVVNRYVADDDGVELQLAEGGADDGAFEERGRGGAWDHLAVGVEDVDRVFAETDNYGVVAEPADQPAAGSRVAFVEDPDGHVLELVEPLEE